MRRPVTLVILVAGMAIAGALLERVAAPVWGAYRERQPALQLESATAAAGQGVTLALLGGFRALVADAVWLRLYALWERQDIGGTDTLVRLVTAIDPRPLYFWLNGARMLAYDVPAWRIHSQGGFDAVPAELHARINREQARVALEHLASAMQFHPDRFELWVERANIELNRLGDLAAAAASYRRAWEQPNGPYYAARLHAEVLRRDGRLPEALAWLKQLHPMLPPEDEAAAADVVLNRIRELERQLGVAPAEAYRPARH
jgi:tetratricopeptide (TPR) repeat protein